MADLVFLLLLVVPAFALAGSLTGDIPVDDIEQVYIAAYGCRLTIIYGDIDKIQTRVAGGKEAESRVERRVMQDDGVLKLYFFPQGFDLQTDVLTPGQMMKLMGHYLISRSEMEGITLTVPAHLKDAATVRVVFGEYSEVQETHRGH